MSFKSWPWRSRRRSDTLLLLQQSTANLKELQTVGRAFGGCVIRTPSAEHDGSPLPRDEGALAGRDAVVGFYETTISEGKPRGEVHPAGAGGTRRRIQRHPGRYAYHLFALHPHANQEPLRVDRVPPFPVNR